MNKLITIVSGALLLGAVNAQAQDTIELTSVQMDEVTAGFATAAAAGGGVFLTAGVFTVAGTNSAAGAVSFETPGFSSATAGAANQTGAFTVLGGSVSTSSSGSAALVIN